MNENIFLRTEMLFGSTAMEKLKKSSVLIFGIGGVGGHCAEAIVRSGIGSITLVDKDTVDITNVNRQIFATLDTVGMDKTDAAYKRLKSINPDCDIKIQKLFYLPETANEIDFSKYDYVVDAVDTVTAKIEIAVNAKENNVPLISSMGTGNKLNPAELKVADLYKTEVCPLARIIRRELKKRGVEKLKVVYSEEKPYVNKTSEDGKPVPASNAFVPATAGLIIASEVIKDLISFN